MPTDDSPQQRSASFKEHEAEAQQLFGSLLKALRNEKRPPLTQRQFADNIERCGAQRVEANHLWEGREVRRLESGAMPLTPTLVHVAIKALELNLMDEGLLYEVAHMNGVRYAVTELLSGRRDHPPLHEVAQSLPPSLDAAVARDVLRLAPPPISAVSDIRAIPSLRGASLELPAAREIFSHMVVFALGPMLQALAQALQSEASAQMPVSPKPAAPSSVTSTR